MSEGKSLDGCLKNLIKTIISISTSSLPEYIPPYKGKKYGKYFENFQGPLKNPHLYTDKPLSQRLFEEFLRDMEKQIKELEEYKNCVDLINISNAFKNKSKLSEIWGKEFEDDYETLFSSIWKVVKSSYENGSFDDSTFIKEYQKLESFFYDEKTTLVQILVPLYNLKIDCNEIDFSQLIDFHGKAVLRSMTDEELSFLISAIGGYSNERTISLHKSDVVLYLEYHDIFYFKGEYLYEKIETQISELITALRLLKKGYVGASFILVKHPLVDRTFTVIPMEYDLFSLIPFAIKSKIVFPNSYVLQKEEFPKVQNIVQLLKKINKNDLAIRRFNSAYGKTNKADKFLDFMIVYEALYSGTQSDSVSHKLAWRFSKLLGNSLSDKRDLFDDMKKVYNQRNKLVHGGGDDIQQVWIEKAEDYMRRSITEYLSVMDKNSFTQIDQFIDYLDFVKT